MYDMRLIHRLYLNIYHNLDIIYFKIFAYET